jgi:hypothetical protein
VWQEDSVATKYYLEFTNSNQGTTITDSTENTSYTPPTLTYETTYNWRVRATNDDGPGAWSDTWSFTTEPEPITPVNQVELSSPTNNSTDLSLTPTLTWQADSEASSYRLEVSTDEFATMLQSFQGSAVSYTLDTLAYETTYSWRVRATNEAGDGDWSNTWSFTTEVQPTNGDSDDNGDSDGDGSSGDGDEDDGSDDSGDTDDPDDNTGDADSTTIAKVQLLSPENDKENNSTDPVLTWIPDSNATHYEVHVTRDNFATYLVQDSSQSTSYQLFDLANSAKYTWRVRAKNDSMIGEWSQSWSFYTESEPLQTSNESWGEGIPQVFSLQQNYPNPFNPSTVIRYAMPQAGEVQLEVYDMMGRKVSTLVRGTKSAGYHEAVFDASHLGSGAYMYRLMAGDVVLARTLYLIN